MRKIARVFPRRTKASPTDEHAWFDIPPLLLPLEYDEVHVSVCFTYDMERTEVLAEAWRALRIPVTMGGPAFNEPGGDFIPGRYIKQGYTITSRGCPGRCLHCSVPKREGYRIRELPIKCGTNVLDDNLLACSDGHVRSVFEMLERQQERPIFSGGLDARYLQDWHIEWLFRLKPRRMYFAYDDTDDYEPLLVAGKLLMNAGFKKTSHIISAYVLIGYPGDSMEHAERRLRQAWDAGFFPYAMLYKNDEGFTDPKWRQFQRLWCRPSIVSSLLSKR